MKLTKITQNGVKVFSAVFKIYVCAFYDAVYIAFSIDKIHFDKIGFSKN